MRSENPSIELFLSPADARDQSLVKGLDAGALVETPADRADTAVRVGPNSYLNSGGDPNSLREQGWGVIVPRGDDGDRLLALARPLLDKRAEDQEGDVPVYRVAPDMTATQTAAWLDRKLVGNAMLDEIPGYLLVLGRPDQVSFELQQVLTSAFSVGRVGFDTEAGYEAYVHKLLRSERAPAQAPRAVYFTARDGTPATELGHQMLMQPCIADAEQQRAAGRFAASVATIEEEDPAQAVDRLLAAAAQPGVLFSCSHGTGAPRDGWGSHDRRRALQGALCMGRGQRLETSLLAQAPFLPGGVWLMFACFGAGTPRHSAYHPWLTRLKEHGEYDDDLSAVLASLPGETEPPFIAALPQAALANPDGPLAIIGHLDLAWSYGFQDIEKMSRGERHRRFHELVAQLVKGSRMGLALGGSLMRARNQVQTELGIAAAAEARAEQELPEQRARLGHRWMVLQDLDGYIALGDPAARLAVAKPAAVDTASVVAEVQFQHAVVTAHDATADSATSPATPPVAPAAAITASAIQSAVHELIAGRATLAELAIRFGVARATIEEWRSVYTEAGLRAVAELIAQPRGA